MGHNPFAGFTPLSANVFYKLTGVGPYVWLKAKDAVFEVRFYVARVLDESERRFVRPATTYRRMLTYWLPEGQYIIISGEGLKRAEKMRVRVFEIQVGENEKHETIMNVLHEAKWLTYVDESRRSNAVLRDILIPRYAGHSTVPADARYTREEIAQLLAGGNDLVTK